MFMMNCFFTIYILVIVLTSKTSKYMKIISYMLKRPKFKNFKSLFISYIFSKVLTIENVYVTFGDYNKTTSVSTNKHLLALNIHGIILPSKN